MTLEYLSEGIYVSVRRRVVHIDMPRMMASVCASVGGEDTPVRRRRLGRVVIQTLREGGCAWPILLRYSGLAGRQ